MNFLHGIFASRKLYFFAILPKPTQFSLCCLSIKKEENELRLPKVH